MKSACVLVEKADDICTQVGATARFGNGLEDVVMGCEIKSLTDVRCDQSVCLRERRIKESVL